MKKNFYNIDEISQIIGEEKHTIRFWENRIEKLVVVDKNYKCIGLITVKDIQTGIEFVDNFDKLINIGTIVPIIMGLLFFGLGYFLNRYKPVIVQSK